MWGSQEKNLGQKVNEKFSRVDQGKKTRQNIIFQDHLFRQILLNDYDFLAE